MNNLHLHHERMSAEFEKQHLVGLPFEASLHHFTGADTGGPHDHPYAFTTHILRGSYVERVWRKGPRGWFATTLTRYAGSCHRVEAECIHEIIDLPQGECYTIIIPEKKVREPRFWKFGDGSAASRQWNETEYR